MRGIDANSIGTRIRELRKKAQLTQKELADKLYVSVQAVSYWEKGRNLPDVSIWREIEQVLGKVFMPMDEIIINSEYKLKGLTLLTEIDDYEKLIEAEHQIVNAVEIDAIFAKTIRTWIHSALALAIGYEVYYKRNLRRTESGYELSWQGIGFVLSSMLSRDEYEFWASKKPTGFPFTHKRNNMAQVIEYMSFQIGGDLFEDFDENGYRQGFVQQVGSVGERAGDYLTTILPDDENSILMVIFRSCLAEMRELLGDTWILENDSID